MKTRTPAAIALSCLLVLPACENLNRRERVAVGAATGAVVGLITADALAANSGWTIVAALTGAALGTLVARNSATDRCAYARGGGYYETRPCR